MTIQTRIDQLQHQIRALEKLHHRKLNAVHLLAVSKGRSVQEIIEAHTAGLHDFAENYYQEAIIKINQLSNYSLNWHFIGPIQSNKAKGVAIDFNWVHSVSSSRIAVALNRYRPTTSPPLNVLMQINIDHELSKSGINAEESLNLAQTIMTLPRLNLRGIMIIPKPNSDNPFKRAAELLNTLNQNLNNCLDTLSMGMTDSIQEAIQAGATIVRIGRGIFGARTNA